MHIPLWQPILTAALIVALWYIRKKKTDAAPKPAPPTVARPAPIRVPKPEQPPEVVYMNLRQQALTKTPETLGLPAGQIADNEPFGLVMEMAIPNSVVTLASFADGDAGVYYKAGGGMIGGSAHDNVRKAAKEFVLLSGKTLPRMRQTTVYPLPGPDKVTFFVLTPQGVFATQTDREALGDPDNELSALFYAGQEVVAQMRQAQAHRTQTET